MKRFVVVAVAVVAVGLGSAGTADAQLVYGYNNTFGGAYNVGRTFITPGAYQTYNSYYSPFTRNLQKQVFYSDIFGNTYGRAFGYSPFTGGGYNYGFYRPNPYLNPFGGYSYGFYRRGLWW